MEKLKAKHDHKLTDILKVMIFALFLILPGLIVLPSMLYYGVNEHATAPSKTTEVYEERQVNFNQLRRNIYGEFEVTNNNIWEAKGIEQTNLVVGNIYYVKLNYEITNYVSSNNSNMTFKMGNFGYNAFSFILPPNQTYAERREQLSQVVVTSDTIGFQIPPTLTDVTFSYSNLQVYDLTLMFGSGNEPTIEEFNTYYPNSNYQYTESKQEILNIDTGQTETYTDITSQIQYNWTSLWKQPLFNWTNYTIVKQGIDNFTGVFGITNTSNISNLIAYELIIVAIYIVIDIVLTLFKWLTHLIGEK